MLQKIDVRGGSARTYYAKRHEISYGILRFDNDTHGMTIQAIVEQV